MVASPPRLNWSREVRSLPVEAQVSTHTPMGVTLYNFSRIVMISRMNMSGEALDK